MATDHLADRVRGFAGRVDRLRSPAAVLDGLHDVGRPLGLKPLGIWDLPRIFHRPEWPWKLDKTIFIYRGAPKGFIEHHRALYGKNGYSVMTLRARQTSAPFTFSEAETDAKANGSRKRWVFNFMRSYGFNDGLYCSLRGWTCIFVSAQLLALSRGDRAMLSVAAMCAVSRIEDMVLRPRKGAKKSRLLTARERDVLQQLAILGNNAAVAEALGISRNSVNEHLGHAREKLKVQSTAQALLSAYKFRLIEY